LEAQILIFREENESLKRPEYAGACPPLSEGASYLCRRIEGVFFLCCLSSISASRRNKKEVKEEEGG